MRRVMTAVREVDRSEFPTLARTFARAFDDDPVMAWFLPNEQKRPARIEKFFRDVELGGPFGRDGLVCATDGLAAGAIWLPPGKWRLGGWDQLRTLPQFLRHISWRYVPSRVAAFQQIEQRHPPEPLHWYLATLGTDPVRQGQGSARRCSPTSSPAATPTACPATSSRRRRRTSPSTRGTGSS